MTHCNVDSQCPFQYFCNTQLFCQHYPILPLRLYPTFIYLIFPFAITVSNLGGLSGGSYKIIIFMNMLNYSIGEATVLIYIIVASGALSNLITLIPRKNPYLQTSLIDYNIVLIMFPGLLLGTTIGVLIKKVLFQLIQDILVIILLIIFINIYFKKYFTLRKKQKNQKNLHEKMNEDFVDQTQKSINQFKNNSSIIQKTLKQKLQFYSYQKGYHPKEILITLLLFSIITIVSYIAQGKIIPFKSCTNIYWISLALYIVFVLILIYIVYLYIRKKISYYKQMEFPYPFKLLQKKIYIKIGISGFFAGLCQGIMGIGSGFIIINTVLSQNVSPQVASAISGYIIFFTGLSSLLQALVIGQLKWSQSFLLFGITFIGGYILTEILRKKLKNKKSFNRIILLIISLICLLSLVGVLENMIYGISKNGIKSLLVKKEFCK